MSEVISWAAQAPETLPDTLPIRQADGLPDIDASAAPEAQEQGQLSEVQFVRLLLARSAQTVESYCSADRQPNGRPLWLRYRT